MKRKRAVVVGFDYYAKFLAEMMTAETSEWRMSAYDSSRIGTLRAINALRRADALISFGGPAPTAALIEAARRRNIPVFVIWAGSDVIKAQDDPFTLEVTKQEHFVNLSDGPWLVDELRTLGISAEYLPLTAVGGGGPVKAFPNQFRVLTYLPEPRRDFYGASLIYDIARALPDVPFTVVGPGGRDERAPANVYFAGKVNDMQDRIDDATVLLRQPEHDGKSMLVLEALARARHVVWNYPFPGVHAARGFDEAVRVLQELRDRHARGNLELNHAGRTFVLENFARKDVARRFAMRLSTGIEQWRAAAPQARHRVALSGLGLFCAEIAQYGKVYAPHWETRHLRTNSRLDVLTSIFTLATSDVWYSIGSPITDRWVARVAKILRKPRVIHWVGSDIAWLAEDESLRKMLAGTHVSHLAEVSWTADQLREVGFLPQIAPLPPRHLTAGPVPLPEKFTVMLYVPRTRTDFYGRRDFERLMQKLAGKPIRYLIVGGGDINIPAGVDAENLRWRDTLPDAYRESSVLIRFTPRDGLSLMVLEALSFGRHVLWTQQFPHTRTIYDFAGMEREINDLLEAHLNGTLQPQYDAAEMIAQQYNPEKCMDTIAGAWAEAIHAPASTALAVEAR